LVNGPRRAAALIIGNELLTGKTADANLVLLARSLREIGIALVRVVMIPDDCAAIVTEVRSLAATHDFVFTSGGLGPTHDDVTVEAVARAFDVPTEVPDPLRQSLERYFGERMTEGHLRMARVPRGARLLGATDTSWPTIVMGNVWLLPGPPATFARKMSIVRGELGGAAPFVSLRVRTRLDECTLKPWLDRVVSEHPEVEIGSYPQWLPGSHHTEITFDARDAGHAVDARDAFVALLPPDSLLPGAD
jgi:molybdenum cofactor synthesis domain-containing protein